MLLALNIGNAEIAIGVWDTEAAPPVLRFTAAISARMHRSTDEYAVLLGQIFALHGADTARISHVILASVVPNLTDPICAAVARFTPARPLIVGPGMRTGLQLRIDTPAQLGADLAALAAAARADNTPTPAVIVSLETTTTLTVLDTDGALSGVIILPGIDSSAAALERDTALLTQIPLAPTCRIIGRNTAESVRSGIFWGAAAQIDGLCDGIERELGLPAGSLTILATGTHAHRVMPLCRRDCRLWDTMLFDGLLALWQINCRR